MSIVKHGHSLSCQNLVLAVWWVVGGSWSGAEECSRGGGVFPAQWGRSESALELLNEVIRGAEADAG